MQVTETAIQLVRAFAPGLVPPFGLALQGNTINVTRDHPLYLEVVELAQGNPCSLPYFGAQRINWVTFGGHLEGLYRVIEDIRAWLIPNFAWEEAFPIVAPEKARTPLATSIVALSPHGYF